MSDTMTILLHLSRDDESLLDDVNTYVGLCESRIFRVLQDPTMQVESHQELGFVLAIGTFERTLLNSLVGYLLGLEWQKPEAVQILVNDHQVNRFLTINVFADDDISKYADKYQLSRDQFESDYPEHVKRIVSNQRDITISDAIFASLTVLLCAKRIQTDIDVSYIETDMGSFLPGIPIDQNDLITKQVFALMLESLSINPIGFYSESGKLFRRLLNVNRQSDLEDHWDEE